MNLRAALPESWGLLYAAFAFSQGIGLISYWTLPIAAGALVTGLELSATETGILGTTEFAGLFVASLVLAPFVDRGHRRRIALLSIAVVVTFNLLCGLLALDFTTLAIMRFIAGLGAGLALAIGNATIANARDAERFSGHMTLVLVIFMVVVMPLFSRISEAYGYHGVYLALAVTVLLGAGSWFFLPDGPAAADEAAAADAAPAGNPMLSIAGLTVLAIALAFGVRDTLPWAVAEQLGTDAGMTVPEVGNLFSLMYAVSILGPTALILVARFIAPSLLLAISMTLTGLFAWMFTVSDGNALQFGAGIVIWATIYFMAFAQLNAVAAIIDRKGRLVSAVGSGFIAGVMIAPLFGGILIDDGGYGRLAAAELILTVLICVLALLGLRRHSANAGAPPG